MRAALRRLRRRLALGRFFDVWPAWAVGALLASGVVALACRLFFPGLQSVLPWLWLSLVAAAVPAIVLAARRAPDAATLVALADSMSGGHGLLVTVTERPDDAWAVRASASLDRLFVPHLRLSKKLMPIAPALVFLAVAIALPQRHSARAESAALAETIAGDLTATVEAMKKDDLLTPEEEKKIEEEIERLRNMARQRVDPLSWEAADALRERLTATASEKLDALSWAEESLERYRAAAAQSGIGVNADGSSAAKDETDNLLKALDNLAARGLLAGAPKSLQERAAQARAGRLDRDALRALSSSLSEFLEGRRGRLAEGRGAGRFGRFDPSEFPLEGADGVGGQIPGRGGVTRGRADAELTWGRESAPLDKFKSAPLPPGAARNPDEWAPLGDSFGAPQASPTEGASAASHGYAADPGQQAWRRSLAPRHQTAVKKYFER